MTGTSIDALDAALVVIRGRGLDMTARVVESASWPLGELAAPLRAVAEQRPHSAGEIAALSLAFGRFHADRLAAWLGARKPDLVALHGQTVFHAPPVSWQLINAAPVAHALGVPVVFDLRQADLMAGGQGAPITPLADWILFRGEHPRAIVNLGGFCNITLLPGSHGTSQEVRGKDVCACNHLLDGVARAALGAPYDRDGAAASAGTVDPRAADSAEKLLAAQSRAGRSLGTGDELAAWIDGHSARLPPSNLAASATEALARVIAAAIGQGREVFCAGGGTRHRALMARLSHHLGREANTTQALGVGVQDREAAAMAVLGALCQDRAPITLPAVTGCGEGIVISGAWILP